MDKLNAIIAIIDDDRTLEERNIGLFLELKMNFDSVEVFLKQNDALNFISSNLNKRIIVLLDLDFSANPPDGNIVLELIRDISRLVPVIIWSGADEDKEVFVDLINNQAFGFLDKNASSEEIINKLTEAYNHISNNVDVALEEWINAHSEEQKNQPYMVTVDGKQLTLNDLLNEVRKQTPIGKQFSKSLSKLTIDLLSAIKKNSMINTILTFDNDDIDLGEFFEKCATLTKESADASYNIVEINSQSLNDLNFQLRTETINENAFLFISYTHGSESELLKSGTTPFITESINVSCLKNSLSYCFACHAGKKLGQALINNGAIAFIGFTDELKIQRYFNAYDNFIDCATSGILFFFRGDNLENSVIKMKNKYTDYIDQYYLKDMLIASWFMEHRDALVLLGNSE